MVDDVLRMRALIVADQALAEVRKLQRGLQDAGRTGGAGFKVANVEAQKFAQTIKTIGVETTQTLVPGLMAIGSRAGPIGLVAAAVVGAAVAIKKLATALVEMNVQARGIGISIGQLKAMQGVAEKAGVSVDAFTNSLQSFGDEAGLVKYKVGNLYETLNRLGKFDLRDKLAKERDPAKQMALMLDDVNAVARDKGIAVARFLAKQYQIDPSLVGLSADQLREAQKGASGAYDALLPRAQQLHELYVKDKEALLDQAAATGKILDDTVKTIENLKRAPNYSTRGGYRAPAAREDGGTFFRPRNVNPRSGYRPTSFGDEGAGESEGSRMVQKGVFDALVQFQSYVQSGGTGGGVVNASLTTGGGTAGATGRVGDSFRRGGASVTGDEAGGPSAPASGKLADRIAVAKAAMKDQLRKEGVPEGKLEEASNLLAGQAIAESNLNPTASHDQGTGYGIYGARLGRRAGMLAWMKEHGYSADSLEGQSAYMAHEAMSGSYPRTKQALMNADPSTRGRATTAITSEFERPRVVNPRSGHVGTAAGVDANPAPNGQQKGANVGYGGKAVSGANLRGVNPRLVAAVQGGASYLPEGYTVRPTSGFRGGTGQSYHGHGMASDWQIIGPDGTPIPNKGPDATGMYTRLARGVKTWTDKNDPETGGRIGWGGAFGTRLGGGGVPDLMHFDLGGSRGRMVPGRQFNKLQPLPEAQPTNTARIDRQSALPPITGNTTVNVYSNGTKASASAKSDGFFQDARVMQHRQMKSTVEASEDLA